MTPTLLMQGGADKMCVAGQAEEMHRALLEAGCETELAIYPRGGHLVAEERADAIDAINRLLSWMNRYVRGIEDPSSTALPVLDRP